MVGMGLVQVCPTYVTNYKLVCLEPCKVDDYLYDNHDTQELEHDGNGEDIVATLMVGGHFVVKAEAGNFENAMFWILVCIKMLHGVIDNSMVDFYGQEVFQGDQIVKGK
jgi:hypothetical protein